MNTVTRYKVIRKGCYDRYDRKSDFVEEKYFDSVERACAESDFMRGLAYTVSVDIVEEEVEANYFTEHGYSDAYAYEVIRIVSDQTIEVRAMNAEFDFSDCKFIPGGFSAHCPNPSAQKVTITSNENAPIERIRRTKRGWMSGHRRFSITEKPYAYHDVNF